MSTPAAGVAVLTEDDYDDGMEPGCHTCGGDGFLEANEAHCDWVNFGDELVSCPNCCGSGLLKDCTVF